MGCTGMKVKICINEDRFFHYLPYIFLYAITVLLIVISFSALYEQNFMYYEEDGIWGKNCYASLLGGKSECWYGMEYLTKWQSFKYIISWVFLGMIYGGLIYTKQQKFKIGFCNKSGVFKE
jgi:hypothetical protein